MPRRRSPISRPVSLHFPRTPLLFRQPKAASARPGPPAPPGGCPGGAEPPLPGTPCGQPPPSVPPSLRTAACRAEHGARQRPPCLIPAACQRLGAAGGPPEGAGRERRSGSFPPPAAFQSRVTSLSPGARSPAARRPLVVLPPPFPAFSLPPSGARAALASAPAPVAGRPPCAAPRPEPHLSPAAPPRGSIRLRGAPATRGAPRGRHLGATGHLTKPLPGRRRPAHQIGRTPRCPPSPWPPPRPLLPRRCRPCWPRRWRRRWRRCSWLRRAAALPPAETRRRHLRRPAPLCGRRRLHLGAGAALRAAAGAERASDARRGRLPPAAGT